MAFLAKANFAKGTLSAAIASTDTSLTLNTGHTIPKANTTDKYRAIIWDVGAYTNPFYDPNYEFVDMVWSGTGDTYNITRAQEGTAAASHPAGAAVRIHISAGQITELENAMELKANKGIANGYAGLDASALLVQSAKQLRESGGTDLVIGTVADGEVLKRSGTSIVGTAPGGTDPADKNNIALNRFLIESMDSVVGKGMVDGIVDDYEDESGIDTINSVNQSYDSANKLYEPAVDTYTKLLLHCDGADGSTYFPDSGSTGHTVTAKGSAQVDTAKSKFGGASGYFPVGGDRLEVPNHADWDLGSGDFTIDFWVMFTDDSVTQSFVRHSITATGWAIRYDVSGGSTQLALHYAVGGTWYRVGVDWSPAIGTWYHIAVVRSGTGILFFVDGTQVGTTQDIGTATIDSNSNPLTIPSPESYEYFVGWLDEVRISKGIARWTSDFTTPSSPYGIAKDMILLSNAFTAQVQPDTARVVLFEEDIDSITLNTDLKAYASRDGGTTWGQFTLSSGGVYGPSKNIIVADSLDISSQPSGTSMKYKIETANNKLLKLHGTSLSWA